MDGDDDGQDQLQLSSGGVNDASFEQTASSCGHGDNSEIDWNSSDRRMESLDVTNSSKYDCDITQWEQREDTRSSIVQVYIYLSIFFFEIFCRLKMLSSPFY